MSEYMRQLKRQERFWKTVAIETELEDPDGRNSQHVRSDRSKRGWTSVVYFTDRVSQLWEKTHSLSFPKCCCVCLSPAELFLSAFRQTCWPRASYGESIINGIPHCAAHGRDGRSKLACWYTRYSEYNEELLLCGLNLTFLHQVESMNRVGECYPPWKYFPRGSPTESWWRSDSWPGKAWWPFWNGLSSGERADYFRRWDAPVEWVEYFAFLDEYNERRNHESSS